MVRRHVARSMGLAVVVGGLLWGQPRAGEPAATGTGSFRDVAAVKAKAAEFERRLDSLKPELDQLRPRFEALAARIKEQVTSLKAIAAAPDAMSAEVRARAERVRAGEEAAQAAALQGWQELGNEGLVLASRAAEFSRYQAVRRTLLKQALALGEPGYGVVGLCYERLPVTDRVYLAEIMAVESTPDTLLLFLAMAKDADPALREALIYASDTMGQMPLFVAALAHQADAATVDGLIAVVSAMKGEDALLLLYAAAAKAEPQQRLAAAKLAAGRGEAGLVILAGAFSCPDPGVRTEVVRGVNAIGGKVAEEVVRVALQDPDPALQAAARNGLAAPPPAAAAPAAK